MHATLLVIKCTTFIHHHKICPQNNKGIFKQSCDDKSDKIFPVNSRCTTEKFQQIYQELVCDGLVYKDIDDEKICTNITAWIQEKTTDDYLDPHNCQSSCKSPEYGCEACTNQEYSFQCVRNGTKVCLHLSLKCDGHPQCDHAEDEDLNFCMTEYIDKHLIEQYATFSCNSSMYPSMRTIATACNNVQECQDGSDENCSDALLSRMAMVAPITILAIFLGLKISRWMSSKCCPTKNNPDRFDQEDIFRKIRNHHNDLKAILNLNNFLLHTIHARKMSETKEICKEYYAIEKAAHNKNHSEILCCLHQRLDPIVIEEVLDAEEPGLKTRVLKWIGKKLKTTKITTIQNKMIQKDWLNYLLSSLTAIYKIESSALDILKDLFLAILIMNSVGGPRAIWEYQTNFSSIVAMLAFVTVTVPILLSSLQLMIVDPWAILPFKKGKLIPRVFMMIFCLLLFGITPILLLHAFQSIKEDALLSVKKKKKSTSKLFKKYRSAKRHYVDHLNIELGMEIFYQIPLQATLLLLATTTTPTTGGLETLFTRDSMFGVPVDPKIALGLSVAKSIFSCVNLHLNTIVVQKVFVPFTSKVMIWTWGLFATLRRILSIVTYFIPFFGLFDILNHWKAEHIPFWIRYSSHFPKLNVLTQR